jgi:hypothetical protein
MGQPQLYVLRFGMRALPGRGAAAAAAATAPTSPHEKLFNAFHIIFLSARWRCHTIPTHTDTSGEKEQLTKVKIDVTR